MASKENEGGRYSAKPFQLRPSVLGSTKTDLSSCNDSALQKESKSFMLRPSALTAIADKIDTRGETEQRKRQPGEESEEEDENKTEEKRRKLSDSSNEVNLQLTEPLPKPTGIGSFGFGAEENMNGASAGSNDGEKDQNEASSGFVFGQNISARVTGFKDLPSDPDSKGPSGDKSDMVPESEKERLLMEAAHEHMHNLSKNKQQLQEVETFNGEEGERNVLMVQCKVHLFDSVKMIWLEKGRGTVKLNDMCQSERFGVFQSRIVFRTQGNHLVVFNAKLWPQMKCEKASEKSVRITAMDADTKEVKIFLISATSKDVHQLFTAIDRRIQALRRNQESHPSTVDESCDSNDNESRVADDEDSRSEDSPSSRSPSLDQTHPEEDPEQSFESCNERQENKKDHSGSEKPDSGADEADT